MCENYRRRALILLTEKKLRAKRPGKIHHRSRRVLKGPKALFKNFAVAPCFVSHPNCSIKFSQPLSLPPLLRHFPKFQVAFLPFQIGSAARDSVTCIGRKLELAKCQPKTIALPSDWTIMAPPRCQSSTSLN